MQGFRQHPFRVSGRFLWFAGEVSFALLIFLISSPLWPKNYRRHARAGWLRNLNRRALAIFKTEILTTGPIPTSGLLISNHLSYLDILVLSTITPAVFVAKREVKAWPVMGLLARLGGTVFIDRRRRTHVGEVNGEIQAALNDGALVVIFPEGTSSDGQTVLPFKSSLLELATQLNRPLTVSHLQYALTDGDAGREVCYWGDAVFLPHLINLFSKRTLRVNVRFATVPHRSADRKELAQQLHSEVMRLKN